MAPYGGHRRLLREELGPLGPGDGYLLGGAGL